MWQSQIFNWLDPKVRNHTYIAANLAYIEKIWKLGSVTSFRIKFHWYVAEKSWTEMCLLRQSYQIIINTSIWQGNLVYHTFLMVKGSKKNNCFCRVMNNMYVLLSTLLYWLSGCVVAQGWHVSSLWVCHKGDACVTCSGIVHHHYLCPPRMIWILHDSE